MEVHQAYHDGSIWGNEDPDVFVREFPEFKPLLDALRAEEEWGRSGRTGLFFVDYGQGPLFKFEIKANNGMGTVADLRLDRAAPPSLADVKARVSLVVRVRRLARRRTRSLQPA